MKIVMTLPLDLYRRLERQCDVSNQRSRFLKSGLIHDNEPLVSIRCDGERALDFISWANTCAPGAAGQIQTLPED